MLILPIVIEVAIEHPSRWSCVKRLLPNFGISHRSLHKFKFWFNLSRGYDADFTRTTRPLDAAHGSRPHAGSALRTHPAEQFDHLRITAPPAAARPHRDRRHAPYRPR